jgi:hypothetical protein
LNAIAFAMFGLYLVYADAVVNETNTRSPEEVGGGVFGLLSGL